jgi:heat shock protein HslJ
MNAEDLDVRMQAAGEQWRTANAVPADVDFAQPTSAADDVPVTRTAPPRSSRRRMRVVLAAGVGVAAAAAAAILVVSLGGFSPAHRREAAGTARPLVGTEWQLTTFVSADGTRSTPVRPASLTFDDRNFSGSDGCNDFGGSVTIDTRTLWVGALGSTLIGCPEPILTEPGRLRACLLRRCIGRSTATNSPFAKRASARSSTARLHSLASTGGWSRSARVQLHLRLRFATPISS